MMTFKTRGAKLNRLCSVGVGAVLAGWVLAPSGSDAGDWAQFRGPTGDGISADAAISRDWKAKAPPVLWSMPLNDDGWGNPCVAKDRVYVVDHEVSGQPGAQNHTDVVRALDFKTGRVIWSVNTPGLNKSRYGFTGSSPAFEAGKLYVVNRAMVATCLDAATGRQIWQRQAGSDFSAKAAETSWGFTASPLVCGKFLILVPGGPEAAVVALNKETGETLWKVPGGPAGYATPILYGEGDKQQVVVFKSEGLIGLNPADGRRLWILPWPTAHNQNSATPIIIGKRIFITSAWGVGAALVDITDNKPTVVWRSKDLQCRFSSPVYLNGLIFGVSEPQVPGRLVCLDAVTGETKWKQPGFDFGPIGAAGGLLLVVQGKTGEIVLVRADSTEYGELGRIQPAPPANAWNNPIVVDGRMLVRNLKSLVCLDVAP